MEHAVDRTYKALLILSGLATLSAILTLIPRSGAPWPNAIGYRSLCSFAPVSTVLCALLAAATCTVRARFFKPGAHHGWRAPIAAGILLLALTALASVLYAGARVDAASGATATAEEQELSEG